MIRVADYIADYIYQNGNDTVFMVSGGGMMFLSDGLVQRPEIQIVCTHHEQAAGMAAESYAKFKNSIAVVYVTCGCGSANAITPLLGAWQDNVPCLFISGQSKQKETIRNSGLPLRQFGVQEADTISIVQSLTKYSVSVNNPKDIAIHLDKAYHYATDGRKGPVWIEVPLDVQSALIDEKKIERWTKDDIIRNYKSNVTEAEFDYVYQSLQNAQRPLIIAGNGIILSNQTQEFIKFIEENNIPIVFSRLGINLLPSDHPLNIGLIGNKGQRAANIAVQNADTLIVLGSRLSVSTIGHEYQYFAREAKKIVIDIDTIEHQKNTIKIDSFINADLCSFFEQMNKKKPLNIKVPEMWISYCKRLKDKYIPSKEINKDDSLGIDLYYFTLKLSEYMPEDIAVVTDSGSTSYVVPQALRLTKKQKYFTSSAQGEMGYSLPGSIGICFAKNKEQVISICGEGSFQFNIQELQTIVHHQLPIKIFVWNNQGYLSIKTTQEKFFDGRYIGSCEKSGVSFPSTEKIADAYGIKYFKIENNSQLESVLNDIISLNQPTICEVICNPKQVITPTVSSYTKQDGTIVSKPLEDMFPFLPREEFLSNMIIKPIDE